MLKVVGIYLGLGRAGYKCLPPVMKLCPVNSVFLGNRGFPFFKDFPKAMTSFRERMAAGPSFPRKQTG